MERQVNNQFSFPNQTSQRTSEQIVQKTAALGLDPQLVWDSQRGTFVVEDPDYPIPLLPKPDFSELDQALTNISAHIQALTKSVSALTEAMQQNTQAMTAHEEEEEVAQTGGLLGTVSDDEPESPHL